MRGGTFKRPGPAGAASAGWASVASLGRQAVSFLALILLARILTPGEFGLFALLNVVAQLGVIVSQGGIAAAVTSGRYVGKSGLAAASAKSARRAVVTTSIIAVASVLVWVMTSDAIASISLAIIAVGFATSPTTAHLATLERAGAFKRVAMIEVVGALLGYAAALAMALLGAGAISLAVGFAATAAFTSLLTLAVVPVKFPAGWWRSAGSGNGDGGYDRAVFRFNLINFWSRNADTVLLSLVSTTTSVGLYSRAYALMLLPVQQVGGVLGRVALPGMAAAKAERRLADYLARAKIAALLSSSVASVLLIAPVEVLETLYGDQWVLAAPALSALAIGIVPQVCLRVFGALYQASGRADRQLKIGAAFTSIAVMLMVVGVLIDGIRGLGLSVSAGYWIYLLGGSLDLRKTFLASGREQLSVPAFCLGVFFLHASLTAVFATTVPTEIGILFRVVALSAFASGLSGVLLFIHISFRKLESARTHARGSSDEDLSCQ